MTLAQARNSALCKKCIGWIIFIISTLSTAVSLLNYLSSQREKLASINAVLSDFTRVIVDMVRFNTSFLNLFWQHSPVPDFGHSANLLFWIVFILIFFGMALNAAGSRQWRQYRYVKEQLEDHKVIENAFGERDKTPLEAQRVQLTNQSPFRQYYLLYILPIIVVVVGYILLHWLSLI
ncbi:YniB-like protein [Rosenbergiella nectarea]|uniref:YniB-like protein n=1 Tax=Rosenbergiella nectarea TaxID=988801 RepID=A0A1H9GGV5_9GAMM|nr:YniB family protein [Rosenbergiella nectarea]SEQ49321.1 YniB-like protein [Rosenbergiella nectarea]